MKRYTLVTGYATTWPFGTAIVVAILIFGLQDYITPVAGSQDLCNSDRVLGISDWVIPKVLAHCEQIARTDPVEYPSMDIAIVLDLWNVVCFGLYLIYTIYRLTKVMEADLYSGLKRKWKGKPPPAGDTIARYFGGPLLFLYAAHYTFISSPLTHADAITGFDSSLSVVFGAAYQAMFAIAAPFFLFITIVFLRMDFLVRRDLQKKKEGIGTENTD